MQQRLGRHPRDDYVGRHHPHDQLLVSIPDVQHCHVFTSCQIQQRNSVTGLYRELHATARQLLISA